MFTQQFIQAQIKENIKAHVTGLCAGKSPETGEVPAQMASNVENVSIWWRHHVYIKAFYSLVLTHWGQVTHICINELTVIGSDNGLSPGRRQAIIWTNAWILLIWPLGTNFSKILIEIYSRKCVGKCLLKNKGYFVPASTPNSVPSICDLFCTLSLWSLHCVPTEHSITAVVARW